MYIHIYKREFIGLQRAYSQLMEVIQPRFVSHGPPRSFRSWARPTRKCGQVFMSYPSWCAQWRKAAVRPKKSLKGKGEI